jgi:hypothetical protein
MSLEVTLYFVAAALVAGAAGHEASHAVVALAVADGVAVAWREPATYVRYAEGATWEPAAVAVAPAVVGVALAGVGPPQGPQTWGLWTGVGIWTVGGGLDEVRGLSARSQA